MQRSLFLIIIILFSVELVHSAQDPPFSIGSIMVKTPSNGTYSTDTLGPVCRTAPLSIYGGWDLNKVEATGFFHVREIDGAWYLVDPSGSLFISAGVTSVERGGGIDLPGALKTFCINNLGNWSDVTIKDIPISPRFNFLQGFKNTSAARKALFDRNIFPVFDPQYEAYCDAEAAKFVAPFKNNPWVLGYYTDNELAFHKIILDDYLGLPVSDPNYIAANQWMIGRKGEGYAVTESDRMEFRGYVADTYASAVNNGLKKYDPNHLNIGCRLHAAAKYDPYILRGIGKHVDVNSINFYARWEPAADDMDLWLREAGKPFLITEFYTKGEDSGLSNVEGAGWKVYTQQDRAYHFENLTMKLLSHQGSVGWTWFRYIDKDDSNKGIISLNYSWYTTLLESMENVGRDIYNLRRYLMGQELDLTPDTACYDSIHVTISVTGVQGKPLSSAAVVLSGELQWSDEIGMAKFQKVPVGEDLILDIQQSGYEAYHEVINLTRYNDTIFVELIPMKYSVTIAVTDEMSSPVQNAFVTLSGYGAMMSDAEGKVTFENVLPADNILYSISREGFRDTLNFLGEFHDDLFMTVVLQREESSSVYASQGNGSLSLFQVPVKDYIIFNLDNMLGDLSVFNLQGNLLYNENVSPGYTKIDAGSWEPGLYIFRLLDPSGYSSYTGKFSVIR